MIENENAKLKQYLLDNLAPKEAEEIDLQVISDASIEEQLFWAENELMEDYLDETLSPPEVELFEKIFLISSERKTQLRQLAMLRKFARHEMTKESPAKLCEESSESFFERLKKLFSSNLHLVTAGLALIIVGSLVAMILYNRAYEKTPLEKEFAQINQGDLSNLAEFENFTKLNLVRGSYRDASQTIKFSEGKFSERILVRLGLPIEFNATDTFKVEVIQDEKVIFSQNKIRFYNNPNGQEIRFLLPSILLKKGDYQIKTERESVKESSVVYNFTVQ